MGVMGLLTYLRDSKLIDTLKWSYAEEKNLVVAIDTWNVIHMMLKKTGNCTMDSVECRNFICLTNLFDIISKKQFIPIFVFDGMFCGKSRVPVGNGAKAIAARTMCSSAEQEPRMDIVKPLYRFCRQLIEAAGYPTVCVPGYEADEACANLFHTKTVSFVISSDTDLLLMGCDVLLDIVPMFPPVVFYRRLLDHINMDSENFLRWFVRCHTDLHPKSNITPFDRALRDWYGDCMQEPIPTNSSELQFIDQVTSLVKPKPLGHKLTLLKRVRINLGTSPNVAILSRFFKKYKANKFNRWIKGFITRYEHIKHLDLYDDVLL
ncbi:tegument host shutoff protein [Testudinid alphaherpesvirus 3]|uniref:Virion host shutoff protein n=1 Tax=Testudinid alphaherpesvirus 3 TaxID=2560801 RepID=A0A0K1R1E2_9ALPH|nr:tegument host shutoff protein [Testudinid alphaherpesvirus 3]AIU39243.1 tegument host shutoff protein [Testudinid alphaherpesvirus 3]AIU39353.1 tegument host shutoff protein [Testudinid alphaherpesvirus 3]AKI81629.1 tegument host shutoff protein [Testudinid alphaherpesvirus 3]AKI81733.1 tegument host shutoff protein [Testudinid alphaherpesvirus 3]AKV40713.1 UL41 virion host shutoff protein [Testudinid alphaherpesvirus 3]